MICHVSRRCAALLGLVVVTSACQSAEVKTEAGVESTLVHAEGEDAVTDALHDSATPSAAVIDPGPDAVNDPAFHDALRAAAEDYRWWGLVDDNMRWAPFSCLLPPPATPTQSAVGADTPHGQKLYYLFAKQRGDYVALEMDVEAVEGAPIVPAIEVGQVLVKEAWRPVEVDPETIETPGTLHAPVFAPEEGFDPTDVDALPEAAGENPYYGHVLDVVVKDDVAYQASELAGLFIIMKLDPDTPGTDDGWVYGTITADGEITSSGVVASCLGCHESATHERLFGHATSW